MTTSIRMRNCCRPANRHHATAIALQVSTKNPLQQCERSRCCVRSSLLDSEHAVDIRASFELVQTVASMPGFGGEPASPWHRPTASIPAMEIAMFRHVACTALLLGGLLAGSNAARAESRLALVIGQSAYRSVTP